MDLKKDIQAKLDSAVQLDAFHISVLAKKIIAYSQDHPDNDFPNTFYKKFKDSNPTENQMEYAIRLMKSENLIYEEVFKVRSLFEGIEALVNLGLDQIDDALNIKYNKLKKQFPIP